MENSIEYQEKHTREIVTEVAAIPAEPDAKKLSDAEARSVEEKITPLYVNQPQLVMEEESNPYPDNDIQVEQEDAEKNKKPKANFFREGYALPDHVSTKYRVRDGKFHDSATDILRFEDKGKSLVTVVEDKAVIKDMLAIATSKNWEAIELKGTDNFRQQTWLEARVLGFDVKGYEPNQHDLDMLAKRLPENQMAFVDKQPETNQFTPELSQEQISVEVARRILEKALARHSVKARTHILQQFMQEVKSGNIDLPIPVTTDKSISSQPENEGIVLGHGNAPYENNLKNKMSYYVKLATEHGNKYIWGVDLKRALDESNVKVGDHIHVEKTGSIPVTVNGKSQYENGKLVAMSEIDAHRNKWVVQRIEPEHGKQQEVIKEVEVER